MRFRRSGRFFKLRIIFGKGLIAISRKQVRLVQKAAERRFFNTSSVSWFFNDRSEIINISRSNARLSCSLERRVTLPALSSGTEEESVRRALRDLEVGLFFKAEVF